MKQLMSFSKLNVLFVAVIMCLSFFTPELLAQEIKKLDVPTNRVGQTMKETFLLWGNYNNAQNLDRGEEERSFKEFKGDNQCISPGQGLISVRGKHEGGGDGNFFFGVDAKFIAVYQCDISKGGMCKEIWMQKFSKNIDCLRIQNDGNMVAYAPGNEAVWSTGTNGSGGKGTFLKMQNDGNLVLYNGAWYGGNGDAIWSTQTNGK
jgi:hypothetical protein